LVFGRDRQKAQAMIATQAKANRATNMGIRTWCSSTLFVITIVKRGAIHGFAAGTPASSAGIWTHAPLAFSTVYTTCVTRPSITFASTPLTWAIVRSGSVTDSGISSVKRTSRKFHTLSADNE
jgi:hypothetical protein